MSSVKNPQAPLYEGIRAAPIYARARVLVAVSGGADSVALAHAVQRLAFEPEHGWLVRVAHVNHRLRGGESDEDEQFVRELAAQLGVQFEAVTIPVREYARARKLSIETAARQLRYAALFEVLDRWHGDLVLTGHSLDDQAETVILNLLRGAGIAGLSGMARQHGRIVRPFLAVSREQISRFLEAEGLPHREDHSNRDVTFTRNRVRLQLLPALKSEQPRAHELIARSAVTVRQDFDFIETQAERALDLLILSRTESTITFAAGPWRAMHMSLRRHSLRLMARDLLGTIDGLHADHIELMEKLLIGPDDAAVCIGQLPHGLGIQVRAGVAQISVDRLSAESSMQPAVLEVPGGVDIGTGTCRAEIINDLRPEDFATWKAVCGPLHALCNEADSGTSLRIRRREPGDRMRPLGLGGSRKVQDLMVDRRVPAGLRDAVPVFANEDHILWIPGVALDTRAAMAGPARRFVHLTFAPAEAATMLESLGHFGPTRS